MLLTASPNFKCFEGFFLPFVIESTVSGAKDSTLFILFADETYVLDQQQGGSRIELIALKFELLHDNVIKRNAT